MVSTACLGAPDRKAASGTRGTLDTRRIDEISISSSSVGLCGYDGVSDTIDDLSEEPEEIGEGL